ncbi:MAG: MltA domain-containing protein [Pseudomonadota bacterium]
MDALTDDVGCGPPTRFARRHVLALGIGATAFGAGLRGAAAMSLPGWSAEAYEAARRALDGHAPFEAGGPALQAFTHRFQPVPVGEAHVTGYYEPVIAASRGRSATYPVPVLAPPPKGQRPLPDRGAIMAGALQGQARPMFWLRDAVALYFLQLQGSGRLRLEDGSLIRVGYGGRNGHPYRSIGRMMRDEGLMAEVDGGGIRKWLRADPARGAAMMARNPSYIFFVERRELAPEDGPVGAMGVPLPAGHAVAVDPAHHDYGALLWLSFDDPVAGTTHRLVMAMDTGAAIRGAGRVDLFTGTGDAAWERARRLNTRGRLYRLVDRLAQGGAAK